MAEDVNMKNNYNSMRGLSALNNSAIVSYALNNCYKDNPSSGNGVVPYYDFSKIKNNYDCTNFVSHALLAGGATVYITGNKSTGWYYVNLANRSYSWSGVQSLYDFLTTNTEKGPAGVFGAYDIFDIRQGYYPYNVGDILQFHDGKVWRHSTIITGFYKYSGEYYYGALVTGRTSDRAYNNNDKAETVYPYKKRVIKLTGNY